MTRFALLVVILLVAPVAQCADNWPNWRGPTGNGVAPSGEYPTKWSATENVAWKTSLPGRGASTPIVWDQRIFLTYAHNTKNVLAALDRTGKILWETELGDERPGKNRKASGCNPSAVTDGKLVFAYFKSGDLACVDFSGRIVWHHNLQDKFGEDTLWWDLGTSPVLTDSCVVVAVMQTGPSYLVAFDKQSGSEVWKVDRDVPAPEEAAQSYSTPLVVPGQNGKSTIYVLGADHVTAHDASTGSELWRLGGLNPANNGYFRSIASPVLSQNLLIAPYARGSTLTAVKIGGSGDVTQTHVAWFKDDLGTDVPTPAEHEGRVYVCTDRGAVACLDAASGRQIWKETVEPHRTHFSASPILAGGRLYVVREDGKTFVLAAGDRFELVSSNELEGETVVATPIFVDGQILIRTYDYLYCIGN